MGKGAASCLNSMAPASRRLSEIAEMRLELPSFPKLLQPLEPSEIYIPALEDLEGRICRMPSSIRNRQTDPSVYYKTPIIRCPKELLRNLCNTVFSQISSIAEQVFKDRVSRDQTVFQSYGQATSDFYILCS